MMIFGLLILIVIFSLVLIKSADIVVVALRRIAREAKVGTFIVSALIMALGTSLPELFVGISSAIEGTQNLSLGVVVGSNIANIALIGAAVALIAGHINVHESYFKRDVWFAFFAGLLPFALVLDHSLSRIDGIILLLFYLAYATGFYKENFIKIAKELESGYFTHKIFRIVKHSGDLKARELGRLFVGIALVLFSANTVVKLSQDFATLAHIPVFIVGLFILAIGTSLPELAFSLRTIKDREPSMFFGNLLGSTIVNSTLILGVVALIAPIRIDGLSDYLTAFIFFCLVFLSFWFFIRSKNRLDRWEAFVLILLYGLFVVVELYKVPIR